MRGVADSFHNGNSRACTCVVVVVSKMEIPTNNSYVSISVKCASEELLWNISYRIISGICQKKVDFANYNESLDLLKREKLHKNQCDFCGKLH